MKTSKMAVLTILVTIIVMAAPASAYLSSQSLETKAERMVDIADGARDRVMDLVALVEADETAMENITDAGLDEQYYGNVSLCVEAGTLVGGIEVTEDGEGWTYLDAANQSLLDGEYQDAIDNAKEALTIFRDVLRSIHVILCEAGVEKEQLLDPQVLQEAIERSLDRITELRALLSEEAEIVTKLDDAENLLNEAQDLLLLDQVEEAADNLREANALISQVCQYLKEVAEELNPSRVRGYLDEAYCYRERFRERFGHAWDEEFDVNGFLNEHGYQNEEEFMNSFQQMIENAQGTEDIDETIQNLNEIGHMIRDMDEALTQEVSQYRARHGQQSTTSGSGFGQEGSGSSYGQTSDSGSGQMNGNTSGEQSEGSSYGQESSGTSGGQYGGNGSMGSGSGSGFGNMSGGGSP